ncbi:MULTISPECIES: two-component system sensor histidine kinase DctB [Pseudomonas]|jgi:two-component system C4-dicarboxylate transport sensor histidine kinase DctB|uniref:C4-dicarboxylate transport sensor protein DctB n=8 Tax=Pseudomonas aeruginosa TaxID=287 RepID=DCTB_PSEAE|nr:MULTISPECIES: two-component system sensor histidine kinase DctB [Pseudomonas]NP_253852.1 two-component sensor [Pseudomonas aeruginosa PAO1]Q9HU20.1 RecName: Full=C4-dicarboxylate transport sensor protein DctB [Pseudomonas aeruginosa PAO1]MBQ9380698.1 two-component system sensor histidine kinase DctB [Pseudomonas sp.]MED5477848.1 two-component system sensor histidine kinase DctB [Pseudomonadota bacterium]HCL2591696.1 two-component system sensor histidine kinase DctB [Pseudomonas aeruginosa C
MPRILAATAGSFVLKAYFHRWRSLVILALLLAPLLWPLQYFAERYYSEQLAEQNRQTLDLYVANLLGTLRRYEELPQILGGLPVLRQALQQPGDPLLQKIANEALADIRRRTGADVIYLLQPDGTTQVASNWAQADSFVHRNFAFRPYYREAMQGRLARFFGLGTTSIKRGYYFASAVKEGSRIIGVLVVKVDLEHIERLWGNSPEQLLVIDNYGVVILSSREDWRFHASRPLSAAERDEIHANIPYPVQDPKPLRLQQSAWLSQSRTLPETGWTVSIYAPRTLIERPVRSVLLIGGATLLALLLLLTLLTLSRRHYLDRIALEAEAKRQLEERVLERTRELENANAQLQQEVHEREQAQRELMRAQDEVVQAGKLTALGTMSASISHELNQPLAAIRSYADNARVLLDHQRTEDARGNLEQISDLTTRMASIIAHLKAYARGARRAPENVQLQPAIEDALSMVASRRRAMNVELLRDVPDAPLWVQAGETRLRQILGNLLTNALDALAEKAPPRRLWVIASQDQHGVTLTLRDNGPGFSEDALAHAHEPFFTTKTTAKGLGLGLAICDNLLRALGGRLEMGNHLEGGAVVRLHLLPGVPGVAAMPQEETRA